MVGHNICIYLFSNTVSIRSLIIATHHYDTSTQHMITHLHCTTLSCTYTTQEHSSPLHNTIMLHLCNTRSLFSIAQLYHSPTEYMITTQHYYVLAQHKITTQHYHAPAQHRITHFSLHLSSHSNEFDKLKGYWK